MNLEFDFRLYNEVLDTPLSEEELAVINSLNVDFAQRLGLVLDYCSKDRMDAHLVATEEHLQPTGIVNGGVYCAIGEPMGSIAAVAASAQPAVGMSNSTDLLGSVRAGQRIDATAEPVHIGARTHLWRVNMYCEEKLVAVTNLKLMILSK